MTTNNKLSTLYRFLKNNGASVSMFTRNREAFPNSYNHLKLNEYIKRIDENNDWKSVITFAFVWDATLEGHEFWEDIHDIWYNTYKSLMEEFEEEVESSIENIEML